MRERLLSVDLGVTTGLALFDTQGGYLWSGTETVDALEKKLKYLLEAFMVTHVVVERPVIIRGEIGDELQKALLIVERAITTPLPMYVEANWWKSHPLAKRDVPDKSSIHVRDAIRMGYVYLRRELHAL